MQALLRDQNKKSPAEAAATRTDAAADTSSSDESKSAEDLVPISAWLGPRNGTTESMPEPEMASNQSSNGTFPSASTSQTTPAVSPEDPEATSSSAKDNRASQMKDISYTAAQVQKEHAQTNARPLQDSGWGQQDGSLADEQGYYNRDQQPAGSSNTDQAAELINTTISSRGEEYTGAPTSALNGKHLHQIGAGRASP